MRQFRAWEKFYTRVSRGEMPPEGRPAAGRGGSRDGARVAEGRRWSRRASRRTGRAAHAAPSANASSNTSTRVQDLLGLDEALIEARSDASCFRGSPTPVVSMSWRPGRGSQRFHVRSYLDAADRALDLALPLGPRPTSQRHTIDYAQVSVSLFHESPTARHWGWGSSSSWTTRIVAFVRGRVHLHPAQPDRGVPGSRAAGRYRVTIDAYSLPGGSVR